ncbi:acetamidase/formamidase family protein [Ignavigranum ruoffiae]|uniref:acetamidase/formamidase family protein n=1 Tax=Ignavigranum ruoffiae TaxID=89093 RepID=UPI0023555DA3|nr:acetamidase/formamidase family protein [Ignavigranum ruoffiae]
MKANHVVFVDEFTNGVLDPNLEMEYKVENGGYIVAKTAPGCWGPMITPKLKGGHEVTKPVFVEEAEIGDAVAIYIENIKVISKVTSSGSDSPVSGNFGSDGFIDAKCPNCGTLNPETYIKGIGKKAIVCKNCNEPFLPFDLTNGYTIEFDHNNNFGVTLDTENAEKMANDSSNCMLVPEKSIQNPIVTLAPSDLVGMVARMRPFLGQLGSTPSQAFPDSHNAGDFGQALIGASHDYAKSNDELEHRTDGHMDINRVREGAILLVPVKIPGAGIYLGDMHAMQGNGEIAGHTTDVSGLVRLKVEVIKNANIEGPIILPNEEDLPYLAKPLTEKEKELSAKFAEDRGIKIEETLPVSFVGTGPSLNDATDCALQRAAKLFNVPVEEIMNRCTITGSIDIGRNPGVVTATFLAPENYLKEANLLEVVKSKY